MELSFVSGTTGSLLTCLSDAARELLSPRGVSRVALLGEMGDDPHLLVEFAPGAPVIELTDWLRLQRELGRRCGRAVELVSVTRLEERVAADSVALTVLYDANG
jgi:predicted nucleotidyltransferase